MGLKDVQARLRAYGYTGALDGLWGPGSEAAVLRALNIADAAQPPAPRVPRAATIVADQPKAARRIDEVIIHCTATPEGRDHTAADIRGWHKAQNWSDIGYHYVVRLDGTVERGRPEALAGAHVSGHNEGTLGVVYVGGVDAEGEPKDTRTPAQRAALEAVVRDLCAKYPIAHVTGHNQYAAKACPSFDVRTDPLSKIPGEPHG